MRKTLIIGIVILFCLYGFYRFQLMPLDTGPSVVIHIPQGSSTKKIAAILEENHLIRNTYAFTLYVAGSSKGNQLQAGQYEFHPGQSVQQIIDKLAKGDVYVKTTTVTIPEGWTVTQIASLLSDKGLVNKDKFLHEIAHGQFSYDFVQQIPKVSNVPFRLEGYLFPKTYQFKEGATEHEIIDRMLAQFQQEWDPSWTDLIKKKGMTMHQAVTLASIVEREVIVDKERPKVAGVYYNRLRQGILLQADATIQYALGKQKEIVTFKDLELNHPYNTYKHKGLPPGPIASPGSKSLNAVVNPEKHAYLFYVTKKDGSGEHYFSETYQQHLKNIALSKGVPK